MLSRPASAHSTYRVKKVVNVDAAADMQLEPSTVTSVDEAMQWFSQGIGRLIACQLGDKDALHMAMTSRDITTSGSFSGIGTPEIATDIIAAIVTKRMPHLSGHHSSLLTCGPSNGTANVRRS